MSKFAALKNKFIPLLLAALMLCCLYSCRVYKISSKEKEWIPYKTGQKIIFQSQSGKTDTIYITKEEKFDHTAPMKLISDVNQSVSITARVPDPFTNVGNLHFSHSYQPIVTLYTVDSETYIDICLEVYGQRFQSRHNTFEKMGNGITMVLGGKSYNDIIIFECNNEKICADGKAIQRLYWSRRNGIVQYTIGEEEWNFSEIIK